MRATMQRLPAIILASMLAGACVATPPPVVQPADARTNALACRSASVTIAFDFEGASQSRCTIEDERAFSILVSPEHAPPINPSAWYAFRYEAAPGPDVAITLRYLDSEHRYRPKREVGGEWQLLETEVAEDDRSARFTLPPGAGVVAGQELDLELVEAAHGVPFLRVAVPGHGRAPGGTPRTALLPWRIGPPSRSERRRRRVPARFLHVTAVETPPPAAR